MSKFFPPKKETGNQPALPFIPTDVELPAAHEEQPQPREPLKGKNEKPPTAVWDIPAGPPPREVQEVVHPESTDEIPRVWLTRLLPRF